jgi:hypothetical protein
MASNFMTRAEVYELISPLKREVAKLKYELRSTKNEFFKLKDSLVYRDMAARVTMEKQRVDKSLEENRRLSPYLTRSGKMRQGRSGAPYFVENSRVNKVKKGLHPVAHGKLQGNTTPGYTILTKDAKNMHNRLLKAHEYKRDPGLKKKPININGKTLTYSKTSKKGQPYSPIGSKTNVGSLGRTTIVNTTSPMHKILERHPSWGANRAATLSAKSSVTSHSTSHGKDKKRVSGQRRG